MDRRLILALAAALAASLLVIAFLLGRLSQGAAPAVVFMTPAPSPPASLPASEMSPSPPAAGQVAEDGTRLTEGADTSTPWATPVPVAPTPVGAAAAAAGDPTRAEVARYFAELDALQSSSKAWTGDANAAAQQLIKDALAGNTSGFDALADANRTLAARLGAVQAPEPCATHLQKTVEVLGLASGLLERMRGALQAGDPAVLGGLSAQAQDLERRAREVDALAAAIKARYGL